jgi:drug/metabolite transporter (DMT)-like permease
MGIAMALASAALYGLNSVFVKAGMRDRPVDNGHFMSVLVNVVLLGGFMLLVPLPPWNAVGVVAFVVGGLMGTWVGRGTSFVAIRLIGPARQAAVLVTAPVFAAVIGWFFLEEALTVVQGVGGIIILLGLLVLLRSRIERSETSVEESAPADTDDEGPDWRGRVGAWLGGDDYLRGFAIAILSAMMFGGGFVASKWGLAYFPSALAGAFLGAGSALSMIVVGSALRGRLARLAHDNLKLVPWWFVAGGAASSLALLFQYAAFGYLPAWVVSLLVGTQAIWTLLWASLLLRREEPIGRDLVISVLLVVAGLGVTTYGM